jgi:F0F1-type ATP synthase assembly protein I
LAGRFLPTQPIPGNRIRRVLNTLAAGRRQASRILVAQTMGTGLVALVYLVQGPWAALGALLGGGAVALGSALMAWRAFGGGVAGAGAALFRLLGGLALKWLVIVGALYLALARFELPPLPVIVGLGAALVASLLGFSIKS